LAFDTNRYRDFSAGEPDAVELLQTADRVYLPFIVLAELRAGFRHGTKARANENLLSRFLDQPRVERLFPDEQTTFRYAELYAQLRRQGTPIPINDLWIAALVSQHGLTLCTRDQHFRHLPQIPTL
jgi:tRNA(fMet)-specific endonuclease VapC